MVQQSAGHTKRIELRRIAILTSGFSYAVRKGLAELVRRTPDRQWLVLEHRPPRRLRTTVRGQWRHLKRNGWRWIPYQLGELLGRATQRGAQRARFSPNTMPGGDYELDRLLRRTNVRHCVVDDLNAPDCLTLLQEFNPDLGISLAAPILREPLLSVPRMGTINLHKGQLPSFRGMPPAFWELWYGAPQIGCTIHRIERGLDTGPILLDTAIPRPPHATVRGVQLLLDEIGIKLTVDAVSALESATATWRDQVGEGRTFTRPALRQERALRQRLASTPGDSWLRTLTKDSAFLCYTRLMRPIARRASALADNQRIVVLLYHRVNDDMRDDVTIGIEQFDDQMRWLRRRCEVVRFEDIVDGTVSRSHTRPIVAVTFDDGYFDNYAIAAPILLRHRVHATFFVTTGRIGSEIAFEHDLQKRSSRVPTMNWEQVAELKDLGFAIGSHTVTHVDCGHAPLEQIREELAESRDTLRTRLGIAQPLFAYPFGGRTNMRPEALELVKQAGYKCCASAFGGHIGRTVDPFSIPRTGISYRFSRLAFQARAEGY